MQHFNRNDGDQIQWRKDLKGYRLSLGFSLELMAKKMGMTAFRLDKIEQGIQQCSEELVLQASEIYGEETEREHDECLPEEWDEPIRLDEDRFGEALLFQSQD